MRKGATMKTEEEIRKELKILQHDVDYTDCSRNDYLRFYAMIKILKWVLEEE